MPEWKISEGLTDYDTALAFMEQRVEAIAEGEAGECIWLLEHPPLYTAGTSARVEDLKEPYRFPVYDARRGGQYTYHGPGQRVVYVMLDLGARGRDVRAFVKQLEHWVIATLGEFNITGHIRDGRVGVWVERPEKPRLPDATIAEDKIAAIASACASGSAFTAFPSMSNRIWSILMASCPAGSTSMALPAWPIWACR